MLVQLYNLTNISVKCEENDQIIYNLDRIGGGGNNANLHLNPLIKMSYAPRKKRGYAKADDEVFIGTDIERFLENNLVSIKRSLISSYNYKLNNYINWTPTIQHEGATPKPKGLGTNNTHYVVPQINSIFGGRTKFASNPTWQDVEEIAKTTFDLFTEDQTATRNIDYWRKLSINNKDYFQACEVKKTTGCFENQPVFIRSSEAQLSALATYESVKKHQLGPSLYIVGSCDYDKTSGWQITWWFIPVKNSDEFLCFNTSNFPKSRKYTKENDGWIKPDGRHIDPPTT